MKTFIRLFLVSLVLTMITGLFSCEKNNIDSVKKGTAEFSVTIPESANAKSAISSDSIAVSMQLVISVTDLKGNPVLTDTIVPLYPFGTGYVSGSIRIRNGEYKLTKFMIINASGVVIYATPLEGSDLAWLCIHPLPLAFTILADQVTRIVPEVLEVANSTPGQFGYASFGFQVIVPLEFWALCVIEIPGSMAPVQITDANLTIYAPNGWTHQYMLIAAVNDIVIQGGSEFYTFVLDKDGYPEQKIQVSAKELLATTKENPYILKIPGISPVKTIVLQPGPGQGKDAMISNLEPDKNFGDYKYFEATFLSEPVLTVMRSNRSLIAFNLDTLPKSAIIKSVILRLSYDLPIPFDNSYITDSLPAAGTIWYGGVLQQIVEPWEESKVTWNTQPKTIETGQVYIAPFIKNANIIDVDVTKLIVPMTASALPNYGMLFRLWPTEKFPGFRFGSSDYPDPLLRPKLFINYTL